MNIQYDSQALLQGRENKRNSQENPQYGRIDGAAAKAVSGKLDKPNPRLAGIEGGRALELQRNPSEAARTDKWMSMFGMSNQGMEWNMGTMNPGPPPPEGQ